jgi:hypothetical protein
MVEVMIAADGVAMYAPLCAFDQQNRCNNGNMDLDDYQGAYLAKRFATAILTLGGSLAPIGAGAGIGEPVPALP